jgi:cytoskeletal protein CcmA (bactofilin family)
VVLGPNDRLVGQLYIEGDLRVAGSVEGDLEATGDVEITGRVKGAVTVYNRLTVGHDGSLIGGDVRVARLTVEDGAVFSGRVSMGDLTPPAQRPVEPAPETAPLVAAATPEPAVAVKPVAEAKPKKR